VAYEAIEGAGSRGNDGHARRIHSRLKFGDRGFFTGIASLSTSGLFAEVLKTELFCRSYTLDLSVIVCRLDCELLQLFFFFLYSAPL